MRSSWSSPRRLGSGQRASRCCAPAGTGDTSPRFGCCTGLPVPRREPRELFRDSGCWLDSVPLQEPRVTTSDGAPPIAHQTARSPRMALRRTKSIGTKVTPDEYTRIQTLAGDQPVSEWVRAAILKAAAPPASDATVLAEVIALRTILLNLHFHLCSGAA